MVCSLRLGCCVGCLCVFVCAICFWLLVAYLSFAHDDLAVVCRRRLWFVLLCLWFACEVVHFWFTCHLLAVCLINLSLLIACGLHVSGFLNGLLVDCLWRLRYALPVVCLCCGLLVVCLWLACYLHVACLWFA